MKRYIIPDLVVITVEDADIVTLSIGENTFGLDFGSFKSGVQDNQSGSMSSVDFSNDFQ